MATTTAAVEHLFDNHKWYNPKWHWTKELSNKEDKLAEKMKAKSRR